MKLVRLIEMGLNETRGKHLNDPFAIQNAMKQEDALSSFLVNFVQNTPLDWPTKITKE
jgi:hypothetical protein